MRKIPRTGLAPEDLAVIAYHEDNAIWSYCVSRMDKSAIYALHSAVLQITILRVSCCIASRTR